MGFVVAVLFLLFRRQSPVLLPPLPRGRAEAVGALTSPPERHADRLSVRGMSIAALGV